MGDLAAIPRALSGLPIPEPQDETQSCGFHLGLWPSHPPLTTPPFFLHSGRLFWVAGTFSESGYNYHKTASDFRKKKKEGRTLDDVGGGS